MLACKMRTQSLRPMPIVARLCLYNVQYALKWIRGICVCSVSLITDNFCHLRNDLLVLIHRSIWYWCVVYLFIKKKYAAQPYEPDSWQQTVPTSRRRCAMQLTAQLQRFIVHCPVTSQPFRQVNVPNELHNPSREIRHQTKPQNTQTYAILD